MPYVILATQKAEAEDSQVQGLAGLQNGFKGSLRIYKTKRGGWRDDLWLRSLALFTEDPDLVPSTQMEFTCNSFRESDTLFWPLPALHTHSAHTCTHSGKQSYA